MNAFSARFFDWVQGAAFYMDVHAEAVDLALDTTTNATPRWIDVGCGPGLVARLAAVRGAQATGIDTDPAMIRASRRHTGPARFELGDADDLPARSADIVSAASLLYGARDPRATAARLWRAVAPGGALLVVETTTAMTLHGARGVANGIAPHRRHALTLWARSRDGATFDRSAFGAIPAEHRTSTLLLNGLVEAMIAIKPN